MTYTQCHLTKGNRHRHAWIPTRFATAGKFLRLKDEDGWEVISTGEELPEEYVLSHRDDYRNAFASIGGSE